VGQERTKQALELTYIAPRIGGVLIRGDRGTGKSTAVRSFAQMVYEQLPVTLPINATDDRIVGGWVIEQLMMERKPVRQPGLLEEASKKGMLYIDEVNLLEDHIVNLILDVASSGQLSVQYESQNENQQVSFVLVGTMNPEEGFLRPQLLDRFGLMVDVVAQADQRAEILRTVLKFDEALASAGNGAQWLEDGGQRDAVHKQALHAAHERLYDVTVGHDIADLCASLATGFDAAGHRGDYVVALAARAQAALEGSPSVTSKHVANVARMALQHRRGETAEIGQAEWTDDDDVVLAEVLGATDG